MSWTVILVGSFGCYLLKLVGTFVPARLLAGPRVQTFSKLLPVALLVGLVIVIHERVSPRGIERKYLWEIKSSVQDVATPSRLHAPTIRGYSGFTENQQNRQERYARGSAVRNPRQRRQRVSCYPNRMNCSCVRSRGCWPDRKKESNPPRTVPRAEPTPL